jgi:hypothetical protein
MLIAPKIELNPAKCILKIAISTLAPILPKLDVKGGYNVQPLPQPPSTAILDTNMVMEGGSNQNLRLFIRGKAMSTQLAITGIIQLPKEPNAIGITSKKIIINAWAVTTTLYTWSLPILLPHNSHREILSIIYVVLSFIKISVYYESIWLILLINNVLEAFLFYKPL